MELGRHRHTVVVLSFTAVVGETPEREGGLPEKEGVAIPYSIPPAHNYRDMNDIDFSTTLHARLCFCIGIEKERREGGRGSVEVKRLL